MNKYPKLWREDKKETGAWKKIKDQVDRIAGCSSSPMPARYKDAAKKCFGKWLDDRNMGDMRVVRNVTKNHAILEQTFRDSNGVTLTTHRPRP